MSQRRPFSSTCTTKSAANINLWRIHVSACLPRSSVKHTADIRANILAVVAGIKPGFLFDYCIVAPSALVELITQLEVSNLLKDCCQLIVVAVEDNLFIIAKDSIGRCCSKTNMDAIIVDVSPQLQCARLLDSYQTSSIMTSLQNVIAPLKAALSDEKLLKEMKKDYHTLQLAHDINRTTLFGILLGYPVLYWYEVVDIANAMDLGSNCLSLVPLEIVRMFVSFDQNNDSMRTNEENTLTSSASSKPNVKSPLVDSDMTSAENEYATEYIDTIPAAVIVTDITANMKIVSSFSFPVDISHECQDVIKAWKETVSNAVSLRHFKAVVQFRNEVMTLPVVAM